MAVHSDQILFWGVGCRISKHKCNVALDLKCKQRALGLQWNVCAIKSSWGDGGKHS